MPPKMVWQVRLKPLLSDEQLQQSPYEIAKELGMSKNTVIRYMETESETTQLLSPSVGVLARYFGLNEHEVIQLVEVTEDEDEDNKKTPLAATA